MFESLVAPSRRPLSAGAAEVRDLAEQVRRLAAETDVDCVDLLEELERLKSAAAAAQARVTDTLDHVRESRKASDAGLGLEVGLARRESPHRGRAHLRLARALLHDLPETLAALDRGDINEHRAGIVVRETSDLTPPQRRIVDRELAGDLPGLGDLELLRATRRLVIRIDESGFLERRARAHRRRRVTNRVLGDGMSQVSATLPSEVAGAIGFSLGEAADKARATGDDRSRDQVRADVLAERLLGSAFATAPPVSLKLVMTGETLFGDDPEPAELAGFGPLPASIARAMVARGLGSSLSVLQRLFRSPTTGSLVAMDSHTRRFQGQLRQFLELRDPICRNPWCNSPVRHADHVVAVEADGQTTEHNGQGLCEACNYAKEASGFRYRPTSAPGERHEVEVTTPTGHRHRSRAPNPPQPPRRSPAEAALADLLFRVA